MTQRKSDNKDISYEFYLRSRSLNEVGFSGDKTVRHLNQSFDKVKTIDINKLKTVNHIYSNSFNLYSLTSSARNYGIEVPIELVILDRCYTSYSSDEDYVRKNIFKLCFFNIAYKGFSDNSKEAPASDIFLFSSILLLLDINNIVSEETRSEFPNNSSEYSSEELKESVTHHFATLSLAKGEVSKSRKKVAYHNILATGFFTNKELDEVINKSLAIKKDKLYNPEYSDFLRCSYFYDSDFNLPDEKSKNLRNPNAKTSSTLKVLAASLFVIAAIAIFI